MTTNANLRYFLDCFDGNADEDSDPDPFYTGEGFVLADLYAAAFSRPLDQLIIEHLGHDNEDGSLTYLVRDLTRTVLGVAYVSTEEII